MPHRESVSVARAIRDEWARVTSEAVDVDAWTPSGDVVILCAQLGSPASETASRTGIDLERVRGAVRGTGLAGATRVWEPRRGRLVWATLLTPHEAAVLLALVPVLWAGWLHSIGLGRASAVVSATGALEAVRGGGRDG